MIERGSERQRRRDAAAGGFRRVYSGSSEYVRRGIGFSGVIGFALCSSGPGVLAALGGLGALIAPAPPERRPCALVSRVHQMPASSVSTTTSNDEATLDDRMTASLDDANRAEPFALNSVRSSR